MGGLVRHRGAHADFPRRHYTIINYNKIYLSIVQYVFHTDTDISKNVTTYFSPNYNNKAGMEQIQVNIESA